MLDENPNYIQDLGKQALQYYYENVASIPNQIFQVIDEIIRQEIWQREGTEAHIENLKEHQKQSQIKI